jgi:tetratricopeptide (TPR) repeat protein
LQRTPFNAATDRTSRRTVTVKRLIAEKIPLLILTAVSCVITYTAQSSEGAVTESLKYFIRILNAVNSYGAYIIKILWPANLAVLYPYPHPVYPMWPPTIFFIFLLLWSLFVFFNRKKRPYLATGWLWYIITLLPVVGLVQVGSQTMADRYTYLPSVGILMIIGFAADELAGPWRYRKIALAISGGLILFALTAATRTQLTYWKDGAALYEHTINVTKDNAVICDYLSSNLLKQGKNELAGRYIIKSLEIEPDSAEANMNMAFLLLSQGRIDEAMNHLRKVAKIKPGEARAYYNMGVIFEIRNQPQQALEAYRQAISLDKTHRKALARAAVLKERLGRTDGEIDDLRLKIDD